MAKSRETFNKKESEAKKLKKKKAKEQKKEQRKENSNKGKSFEDMLAYVDENGQISSEPPDQTKKNTIAQENIRISVPKQQTSEVQTVRKGTVSFFNEAKGYGFIKDEANGDSVFVHVNSLDKPIRENDKVSFEIEMGKKGPVAVRVKQLN